MTVQELLVLYYDHHLIHKVSAARYAQLLRQVYGPVGEYEVDTVPVLVLLRWWDDLKTRPSHANKAMAFWRAAHRWAEGLGLLKTPDQTIGIKKCAEKTRSQTTSPEEWARIVPHLENLNLRQRTYFWTLYLIGPRTIEARTAKPEHLYLDRAEPVWIKPTTKPGHPQVVPIPAELVTMLKLVILTNPPGSVYVFWGKDPRRPWGRTSVQKRWEMLRAKAGLERLWLNDLRRSTASDLLNQGENLGVVQAQLGHRSLSQTAKYAWLAVAPLAKALRKRTDTILERSLPCEHFSSGSSSE